MRSSFAVTLVFSIILMLGGAFAGQSSDASQPSSKIDAPGTKPNELSPSDTVDELKKRIIEIQNKGKLGFKKVVLCREIEGYGVYSPPAPNQQMRSISIYIEPENMGAMVTGDLWITNCSLEINLIDATGKALRHVQTINKMSKSPLLDLYFPVNLKFAGGKLPKGKLLIKVILNDKIKNQTAAKDLTINIEPKTPTGSGI